MKMLLRFFSEKTLLEFTRPFQISSYGQGHLGDSREDIDFPKNNGKLSLPTSSPFEITTTTT